MQGRNIFLLILLWSITVRPLHAEDGADRLDEIRKQTEETEQTLQSVKSEYEEKLTRYKKIQASVRSMTDKEQGLKRELGKVEASQREAKRVIAELDGKIRDVEVLSQKRIRALYMMRGGDEGLLDVQARKNFDQATVYVSYVRRYDQGLMDNLRQLRLVRDGETGKLTALQKTQADLLETIRVKRLELADELDEQKSALAEITDKKKEVDDLLLSLKAQTLRLETVLKGLTGGSEEDGVEKKPKESGAKLLGFEGDGLPTRSFLGLPIAEPRVIRRFGKYKESGIGESFRKGVELDGLVGQVSAIDEGRVAYVGKMPQIGTVVIVDHGKRDYSLYGRLANTKVSVGDILQLGDAVGTTTETDQEGRLLYFEVRRQGEPIDPQELYGKKLSAKR